MPVSYMSSKTITHEWDDESKVEYRISDTSDDVGNSVTIFAGENMMSFYVDSWEDIKNAVDELMCSD